MKFETIAVKNKILTVNFIMDNVIDCKGKKNNSKQELYFFYSAIGTLENLLFTAQNIHTLVIIGQYGISCFNAISELIQLQELWIVESGVTEVPCFEKNCQLKKLCLYSNEISCIPNLEMCPYLIILCLSGNKIHNLKNLDKLTWLQELNLANNKLRRINKVSLRKSELRYLNLAGNQLNFIKDIRNLSHLQKLSSLVFADPLYGDCPLIAFCNYRTYIIHYLPHIKKLDHYSVCEKERHWINHFFKKQVMCHNVLLHKQLNVQLQLLKYNYEKHEKKMHYFKRQLYAMKIKKVHKSKTHEELQDIISNMELSEKQLTERKELAIIQSKVLQQQLAININYCGNINFVEYSANAEETVIQLCKQFLEESLCSIIKHHIGITSLKLHKVTKVSNKQIDQLNILKNETVKSDTCNVILKILTSPGVTDIEKWPFNVFKTDLLTEGQLTLTNCLAAADAEWLNKTFCQNINMLSSLRICERRRICVLIQTPILNSVKQIDTATDCLHMKYANSWNNSNEICQKFQLMTRDIKNPMFVIEYEYIMHQLRDEDECKDPSVLCMSDSNLCVCLSNSNFSQCINTIKEVQVHNLVRICVSGQNISSVNINLELPNLKEFDISFNQLEQFPNSNFIKHIKTLNISFNNIQLIHIQETLSVLEELDISWNCLTDCFASINTFKSFLPNISKLNISNNPFKDVIQPELVKYLMYFYLAKLQLINNCICASLNLPKNYFPCAFNMCKLNNTRHYKLVHLKQNMTKDKEQITLLEKKNVWHAKCFHITQNLFAVSNVLQKTSKIQELCATCCLLTEFPIVKPLKYLIKINLGSNFISAVNNFTQDNFPVLKYLDLTNNLVTNLESMGTFYTLQEFYCGNNKIRSLTEIDNIKTWQMLRIIDLCNNSLSTDVLYKKFIIFHINTIKYISGEYVKYSDISEARCTFGNKLDKHVLNTIYKSGRLANITQLSLVDCSLSKVDLSDEFLPQLESLNLSKNQITYLRGLCSFQNLHTLCLSYNCLEIFYENGSEKNKSAFPKLCTLFLDHNHIKSLINITQEKLPMIKHLFLNNNYLQSVNEIHDCSLLESLILDYNEIETLNTDDFIDNTNLKILSLENNKIKSLEFIKSLHKLEELYVANNCLTNEIEIQYLSSLKNLEEFTFEGNPLSMEISIDKLITQDFKLKNVNTGEI